MESMVFDMWAFIHNAVAHPLLAITRSAGWAVVFHDWTAAKAWPESAT
jgi:hypothetical protein